MLAKEAVLREIDDEATDPLARKLEQELLQEINDLGVGPMGLGGSVTALAVKVNTYPCHIASLPVAINIQSMPPSQERGFVGDNMSETRHLKTPLTDSDVRSLKAGDIVYLSGIIYTGPDAAHKRMVEAIERQPLTVRIAGQRHLLCWTDSGQTGSADWFPGLLLVTGWTLIRKP